MDPNGTYNAIIYGIACIYIYIQDKYILVGTDYTFRTEGPRAPRVEPRAPRTTIPSRPRCRRLERKLSNSMRACRRPGWPGDERLVCGVDVCGVCLAVFRREGKVPGVGTCGE